MKIDLLFISYNRLAYTKLALQSILADPTEEFTLTLWDNASTDGTPEYLESVEDPRIVKKVMSSANVHVNGAVQATVTKSKADLIGVLANDFYFPAGWTRVLAQAHADVAELGQISCWHLGREFYDEARARHKIQTFGRHQILRHPWTDGCGLIKLDTLHKVGFEGMGGTAFGIRLSLRGYVNGFYVPPLCAEHMDYPWSEHFAFSGRLDEWLKASATAASHGVRSMADAKKWHNVVVSNILDDPWDVKYYVGWRRKIQRAKAMLKQFCERT
jgi:glycosyltransferase involved in cell wall biosynthesis